jgi:hypothetical protein
MNNGESEPKDSFEVPTERGMDAETILVTPRLAAAWLTCSVGDRWIDPRRVRQLARMIERGSWKPGHHGIAFDRQGKLIDGRIRLSAIVSAGKDVRMLVVFNVEGAEAPVGGPRLLRLVPEPGTD